MNRMVVASLICLASQVGVPASAAEAKPLATVPARWPGVHLDLSEMHRLPDDYLLVAIRVRGDESISRPVTVMGEPSADKDELSPFSLLSAKLVDQRTGQSYAADGKLPATPFWGGPEIVSTVRRNTWFQLAVRFKVPPVSFDANGNPEEQRVTLVLPGANRPMKDVLLPQR